MKISFDYKNYNEVKFNNYFSKGTFLETFYEWCDFNGIDIEFDKNGG
jgi:hypothetical protein